MTGRGTMRYSRRFINFAAAFALALLSLCLGSCKGRTLDDVEPTGQTIEVVIMQNPEAEP